MYKSEYEIKKLLKKRRSICDCIISKLTDGTITIYKVKELLNIMQGKDENKDNIAND